MKSLPENITEEVEEENTEHQFFYTLGGSLDVTTTYINFDDNGDPLDMQYTLNAGTAGSGSLTFTLRHEPTKPNTDLGDTDGETGSLFFRRFPQFSISGFSKRNCCNLLFFKKFFYVVKGFHF